MGEWGETRLEMVLGGADSKPAGAFKTSLGNRFVDRMVNGIAHEAKAGVNVKLIAGHRKQIMKDLVLLNTG